MTVNYILNKKINITEDTLTYNPHTWGPPVYQIDVIELFHNLIKDNYCVLDIGAQSGAFSLMAKYLPTTEFYAFEPDPINYKYLLENLEINDIKNVITHNIALSDTVGYDDFNICTTHRGLNTLGKNVLRFSEHETQKINIKTSTIDELFFNKKIDLIKIDTEGAEYNILSGGINTIQKYKPKILLEYYDMNLKQFDKNLQQLNKLILDINYKITWLEGDNALIESN